MITVTQLRGYVLEEVLARLIKCAGYDLVAPTRDDDNLQMRSHGLQVRGRGAWHQVDVLGQFRWTPPFSYPLRLFLEAKFRRETCSIATVRQAIGITSDINERVSPVVGTGVPHLSPSMAHHYAYALASTSGFTADAAGLALAHQISLIDLSIIEYRALRDSVDECAHSLIEAWRTEGVDHDAPLIAGVRSALRRKFRTYQPRHQELNGNVTTVTQSRQAQQAVQGLSASVDDVDELFVGTANGPFLLLMKADNPEAFLAYARNEPRHRVTIHWSGTIEAGQRWEIRPVRGERRGYRLTFGLPGLIAGWIKAQGASVTRAAMDAKREFLPRISIFRSTDERRDELFELEFDPERTLQRGRR